MVVFLSGILNNLPRPLLKPYMCSWVAMPNACVIVKTNNISSWQKTDYRCFLAQRYFFYLFTNLVHFWTNQKPAFSIYGINSDIFSISWLIMNFWMLNLSKYIGHHRVYEALLKFVLCLKLKDILMWFECNKYYLYLCCAVANINKISNRN